MASDASPDCSQEFPSLLLPVVFVGKGSHHTASPLEKVMARSPLLGLSAPQVELKDVKYVDNCEHRSRPTWAILFRMI